MQELKHSQTESGDAGTQRALFLHFYVKEIRLTSTMLVQTFMTIL
jgi:hypothetical protein